MTAVAEAALTCPSFPVQIEGRLDDGRWFYFHARYERVILSASPVSFDDAVAAGWAGAPEHVRSTEGVMVRRELPELGEFGAGMIGEEEAWGMLEEMLEELP